jgi:hypothetical protein
MEKISMEIYKKYPGKKKGTFLESHAKEGYNKT